MRYITILVLILSVFQAEAGWYAEAGLFYDNNPPDLRGQKASHSLLEISGGYKFKGSPIAIEIKHRSDPAHSGTDDIISDEIIGIKTRIEF